MAKIKVNWVIPEEKGTFEIELDEYWFISLEEWNKLDKTTQEEQLQDYISEDYEIASYGTLDSFEIIED